MRNNRVSRTKRSGVRWQPGIPAHWPVVLRRGCFGCTRVFARLSKPASLALQCLEDEQQRPGTQIGADHGKQ